MSMNSRLLTSALAVLLAVCGSARAASVTFTLAIDDNGRGEYEHGLFAIYADVSKGDNGGLHGFGIDLKDAVVSAIYNTAPAAMYTKAGSPTKWAGFTGALGQDDVRGTITGINQLFRESNLVPIYGLGQEDGDLSTLVETGAVPAGYVYQDDTLNSTGPLYNAHLLLGWGAYDGTQPSWQLSSVDNVAAVWDDRTGIRNSRVNPELKTTQTVPTSVPEPAAAIALIACGGFVLGWRRGR